MRRVEQNENYKESRWCCSHWATPDWNQWICTRSPSTFINSCDQEALPERQHATFQRRSRCVIARGRCRWVALCLERTTLPLMFSAGSNGASAGDVLLPHDINYRHLPNPVITSQITAAPFHGSGSLRDDLHGRRRRPEAQICGCPELTL